MAEKKESDLQAVLVLVAISTVCAGGLALVKAATADRIAETIAAAEKSAVAKVLPEGCEANVDLKAYWGKGEGWLPPLAEDASQLEKDAWNKRAEASMLVYPGFKDGALCGVAVKTRAEKGYSGKIVMLVGFKELASAETLKMHRLFVLEQSETPGLGAKVTDAQDQDPKTLPSLDPKKVFVLNFYDRLVKEQTFTVQTKSAGPNDVAAITASTITSKAVTEAVKAAAQEMSGGLGAIREKFAAPVAQK